MEHVGGSLLVSTDRGAVEMLHFMACAERCRTVLYMYLTFCVVNLLATVVWLDVCENWMPCSNFLNLVRTVLSVTTTVVCTDTASYRQLFQLARCFRNQTRSTNLDRFPNRFKVGMQSLPSLQLLAQLLATYASQF